MDIYPIQIPKALLDTAPENERMLHLMSGQLANELNILTKLTMIAFNRVSGHEILNRANTVTDVHKDKFTIADGPPIDTVNLPFFCAPPNNWP
jgi:hypothetical protein